MTIRRYTTADIIGKRFGTSTTILKIRQGIANGTIPYSVYVTKENERLDILDGQFYGDGRLYWILGASSGIGHCLQLPSNTKLFIPAVEDVMKILMGG